MLKTMTNNNVSKALKNLTDDQDVVVSELCQTNNGATYLCEWMLEDEGFMKAVSELAEAGVVRSIEDEDGHFVDLTDAALAVLLGGAS